MDENEKKIGLDPEQGTGNNAEEIIVETEPKSKWKKPIIISLICITVIAAFLFILFLDKKSDEKKALKDKANKEKIIDSLKNVAYENGYRQGYGIGFKEADDDCKKSTAKKPEKKAAVAKKTVKPKAVVTTPKQFTPPTTAQKPAAQPAQPAAQKQTTPQQPVVAASTANASTSILPYRYGKMGKTINRGYLEYYILKSFYNEANGSSIPELSYRGSGKLFAEDGEYWIYIDKKVVVTDSYLLQPGCEPWTAYIGDDRGYPAYLPHEAIKSSIQQARGDLSGAITSDDVKKIGQLVPEVANGTFRPNKIRKTNENYANNDNLYYEGWSACSQVNYKKK